MQATTQYAVRELLMEGLEEGSLGEVLRALAVELGKFDPDLPETFGVGRRYARHVQAAASHFQSGDRSRAAGSDLALAVVCRKTGDYFLSVTCTYSDALEMHQAALNAATSAHGGEHPYVAASHNDVANVYLKQGKYEEAMAQYEKGRDILLKVHGPDHQSVASSHGGMADVCLAQGKYEEALELYGKGRDMTIKVNGPHYFRSSCSTLNPSPIPGRACLRRVPQHGRRVLQAGQA